MAISIHSNASSLEAQRNVTRSRAALAANIAKLSTGTRITSAADDAAGLAISESLKSQIRSYTVAERNAADGISRAQTAEGALGEVHNILGRMRELALETANGHLSSADRGFMSNEFAGLQNEIVRIQASTKFNGAALISSEAQEVVTFQVGLHNSATDKIVARFNGLDLSGITDPANASITGPTPDNAAASLAAIDQAISTVSATRSSFGAAINALDAAVATIQTMHLNLSAANEHIRDIDVANETSKLARNQVLTQAGVSMIAQANQLPQLAMNLIGG